jgi:tetratricopeptide (TPR) repeat protein
MRQEGSDKGYPAPAMSGEDADRLREAEERGDADALYELAAELEDKGDGDLAERACLAAAKLGHAGAADSYAHVLYERDEREQAAEWWGRAAEAGDAASAFNAGVAFEELGRTNEAAESYRRAATGGHSGAYANLGAMLEAAGDGIGAEDAYRSGVAAQEPTAAFNLGMLLFRRGDDEEARTAFARAAELGDEDAQDGIQMLDDGHPEPEPYDTEAVRVMVEQGNARPDEPLMVEHWLYLPDQAAAEEVARAASRKGFAAEFGPSANEEGRWVVRARRHIYPRPEVFARARHPLVRLALDEGGEYDGWEAPKAD